MNINRLHCKKNQNNNTESKWKHMWIVLLALALFAQGTVFGQNICKIGSEEFATLNAAVSYARNNMGGTATIEMLTDYLLPSSDVVNIPQGFDITLTTAGKDDGEYPYRGTAGTVCTISRTNSANQLFSLNNGGATFRLQDIRSMADCPRTRIPSAARAWRQGRCTDLVQPSH